MTHCVKWAFRVRTHENRSVQQCSRTVVQLYGSMTHTPVLVFHSQLCILSISMILVGNGSLNVLLLAKVFCQLHFLLAFVVVAFLF